ncbi:PHB depolymerase family esterase [Streptomyces mirabilis]|uniref:PHB depolymerase family esterase n=1 Tax=Streptomyces mirabilis TaxID=68239 RepID=UPI0021C23924|nr:PHB depolymerase family esterase [Streptomyces mirabilis]MCT9112004.1 PHB depolymerase family esterase [Streptomyces mirabilis]
MGVNRPVQPRRPIDRSSPCTGLSDNKFVGSRFARESHLNEYADTNNLVILYPQTDISLLRGHPQGCWDWWGYTGSDYAQKSAPHMRTIVNEVQALGG